MIWSKGAKCLYWALVCLSTAACSVNYSFTGTSFDNGEQTISIQNFRNQASLAPPNLPQQFTEDLRDFYQNNTDLELVESGGDIELQGAITGYELRPVAPTGEERAALNRLTISVKVSYINHKNTKQNFQNRNFSFYDDFPQSQSLSAVEVTLNEEITEQIILDIFNQTAADW